jgi:hypothetical protein
MYHIPIKCNGAPYLQYGESNTDEIIQELSTIKPELWTQYDFRTKFQQFKHPGQDKPQSTHQHTHTIPLYWLLNSWKPSTPAVIYRFSECESLFPWITHLHEILKKQGVEDGIVVKAMFAKLLPQQTIPPHVDSGLPLKLSHRYHWVISSDKSVTFTVDGHTSHWPEGNIYELNNILQHSVNNPSNIERIHFIMDIMPNKYINTEISYVDVSSTEYKRLENMFIKY